jgi:hypothetical protein
MREKGRLLKVFAICFFVFLFMFFISTVCLQALGQEKKTKEKTGIKSEQAKSNPTTQQTSKESEEDIKPPEEEGWIEPGDKELYTLKLNCITPNTGITGGVLIYFGIYVKPPYELKIVADTLLINNLPYYGPIDFRKKGYERWMARINAIKLSDEQEEYISRLGKVIAEIKRKHDELIEKYKDDYEIKIKEVMNDLDLFLKNYDQIDSYRISPGILVEFKIKKDLHKNMNHLVLRKTLRTIRDPETDPPACESDKRYLESLLAHSFVEKYQVEMRVSPNNELYLKAAFILQSNMTDIEKIKKLYVLLGNIYKAKLVFYNFNYTEFLTDFGEKQNDKKN